MYTYNIMLIYIILLLIILLIVFDKKNEGAENVSGTQDVTEKINTIASMYNNGTFTTKSLNVSGDANVNGSVNVFKGRIYFPKNEGQAANIVADNGFGFFSDGVTMYSGKPGVLIPKDSGNSGNLGVWGDLNVGGSSTVHDLNVTGYLNRSNKDCKWYAGPSEIGYKQGGTISSDETMLNGDWAVFECPDQTVMTGYARTTPVGKAYYDGNFAVKCCRL